MDDEWRWKPVGEETEKLLRTVRAKKRRNEFQVVDGGKSAGNSDSLPPPEAERPGGEAPVREIGRDGGEVTAKEN